MSGNLLVHMSGGWGRMSSLLAFCPLCFVRMPQDIVHLGHGNSISCIIVTYLFPIFPHSVHYVLYVDFDVLNCFD